MDLHGGKKMRTTMCLTNYCKKKTVRRKHKAKRKRLEIVHGIKKIIRNKIISFQLKQFVLFFLKKLLSRVNTFLLRKLQRKKINYSIVDFLTNICLSFFNI